ncbi:MAG: hypothetical protein J6S67_26250 [Methanobrevibacter sp.]|nr:hypothetical protein [Methanobrevibacter sp.]
MNNFSIKKITAKSKKGNEYTAYQAVIGLYKSPLFFPSPVEADYLDRFLAQRERSIFKKGREGDGSLDDLDD